MFGVSRFNDKVAVVAGAEHPLGTSCVRRLARFGALVVAIGRNEAALLALAQDNPGRIEPLALRSGRRDILSLLQEAWADEPLDLYIDVMPLCSEDSARDDLARSAGVGSALVPALRLARGAAVMAIPVSTQSALPAAEAREAGYKALLKRFDQSARPARFMGLAMHTDRTDWDAATCLSAGDAALMLCHPISRGLRGGHCVAWAPRDTAEPDKRAARSI